MISIPIWLLVVLVVASAPLITALVFGLLMIAIELCDRNWH